MATSNPNPRPKWDVHNPHSSLGQKWVTTVRKIYHPLGFHKGYNFPLFLVGVGGLMGFVLARLMYLSWDIFSKDAIPGEFYYYRHGSHKVGIILHLAGILPAGFLACFQFVPIIRYKAILFHRMNGYVAICLLMVGLAGAYMVMDVSVGGQPVFMVWVGFVGSMITIGIIIAIVNIKRLQIDVHRAWMLRVWTWTACIASQRLIQDAAVHCAKSYGWVYHVSFKCAELHYMYRHVGVPDQGNPVAQLYPQCLVASDLSGVPTGQQVDPSENSSTWVSVSSVGPGPENAAALLHTVFTMAAWLAIVIHALSIEVYLWLTPAEAYRLRNVSYEKQIEKGLRQRGSFKDAGTTGTRIGDAPEWWSIPAQDYEEQKRLMNADQQAEARKLNESGTESDSGNTMVGA